MTADPRSRLAEALPVLCDRKELELAGLRRTTIERIFRRCPIIRVDDPRERKPYVLRDDLIAVLRVEEAA